ncbi:hypothetical protein [Marinibactrum halimedae]|uniref:ABC transporter substrate-binding protein n=2 Tax=Marinibactrum halimedae TaxID=1444977 RepID=A0AA37WMS5_9GAMM|nr:hypothetical protein [Marinibactrum halimedae]MCD9460752.1 hypothetical protein [Marinibactrum halimedae]GLS26675.1 hypothetical protein GCM10007877_23920 [Marinibactrum halimedae]
MRRWSFVLFSLMFFFQQVNAQSTAVSVPWLVVPTEETTRIRALVYQEHYQVVQNALTQQSCEHITNYRLGNMILVEAILFCQALVFGGLRPDIELVPIPNQPRALEILKKGGSDTAVFTFWRHDAQGKMLFVSEAMVGVGEYFKGLYTARSNSDMLTIKKPSDLERFIGVVDESWRVDLEVFNCLKASHSHISSYPQALRLVHAKRVDYILHNFASSPGFLHNAFDTELIPVPGVKVQMPSSLHYFVNQQRINGRRIASALSRGLRIMRERGIIDRAYEDVTVFDHRIDDWEAWGCPSDGVLPSAN